MPTAAQLGQAGNTTVNINLPGGGTGTIPVGSAAYQQYLSQGYTLGNGNMLTPPAAAPMASYSSNPANPQATMILGSPPSSGTPQVTSSMAAAQSMGGSYPGSDTLNSAYGNLTNSNNAAANQNNKLTNQAVTAANAVAAASVAQNDANTASQVQAEQARMSANITQGQNQVASYGQQLAGAGGATGSAGINYQGMVMNNVAVANQQIQQAITLLQQQGSAADLQANATAASTILTAMNNQLTNTMTLATSNFNAAGTMANAQMNGATYNLQAQQYQAEQQQNQQQVLEQNLAFNQANEINTPYFMSGGQIYNSATHSIVDPSQYQSLGISPGDSSHVTQLSDGTTQSWLEGAANTYAGAGINWDPKQGKVDTIASASAKIKSFLNYEAAVNAYAGTSAAPKPIGQMAIVQQSTGLPTATFDAMTGVVQTYLSQHAQLWNLQTAPQAAITQGTSDIYNELMNLYGPQGYTSDQILPIVQYMLAPNPNTWIATYKASSGGSSTGASYTGATAGLGGEDDPGSTINNLNQSGTGTSTNFNIDNPPNPDDQSDN